jgi:dTMP kinase
LNPDAGLPLPDSTLYLTLPPNIASARAAFGVERYETVTIQTKVKEQFAAVSEEVVKQHGRASWTEISALGTIEEVGKTIQDKLRAVLSAPPGELGRLWQ